MFIKGHEFANESSIILNCDSHSIVDKLEHLAPSRFAAHFDDISKQQIGLVMDGQ